MTDVQTGSAAARWADALAAWAIPQEILDAAPERSPWRFSPSVFAWTPERAAAEGPVISASRRRALDTLPNGGSVLDVGAGGGRASLPLSPPAGLITAVDSSEELLQAFVAAAVREGVVHRTVFGTWPEAASQVPPHDVVVCHNVVYNVANLPPFIRALTEHARRRVVVELTADHPASNLNAAWKAIHGLDRPTSPTAADAIAVLQEMGLDIEWEESERRLAPVSRDRAELVASARQRLCVGADRDEEIDRLLGSDQEGPLRRIVTAWWAGEAGDGPEDGPDAG
jgi:SAM-dependent methyltransferase